MTTENSRMDNLHSHVTRLVKAEDEHSDLISENQIQPENPTDDTWLKVEQNPSVEVMLRQLVEVFNYSPYIRHSNMSFYYENGQMFGRVDFSPDLIGNASFQILHGGVSATILDSIGGLVGMQEILKRNQGTFEEQTKKIRRTATVDLRIDYLSPGRGKHFIATAEVIRLGRKGFTTRMMLTNDEGKAIAHGMASYAF